jgi:integrase
LECTEKLEPFGATIRDAVNFYLPHLSALKRTKTAAELVDELLKVKEADGASERYLSDLRSRLTQFSDSFDGKPVAEITVPQIDEWLRSLADKETGKRLSPVTRNNFRRVLIVAFNFAKENGYCVGNPAERSAKAKVIETAVGILTIDQTARLLESAPAELVPYVATGAFAGLRRPELKRLDWKEVDLQSGLIEVTASKAKSARRRFVKIQTNLAKWLQPTHSYPATSRRRIIASYWTLPARQRKSKTGRKTPYVTASPAITWPASTMPLRCRWSLDTPTRTWCFNITGNW